MENRATTRRRRITATGCLVAAALVVLAGCGSGGSDSGLQTVRADTPTIGGATVADTTVDTIVDDTTVDTTPATIVDTIPATTIDTSIDTIPDTSIDTVPDSIPVDSTVVDLGGLPCPAADGSSDQVQSFPAPPPYCIDTTKFYTLTVDTSQGQFEVELFAGTAPITVNNIVYLARYHFYDNTICHRVVPDFVVQCGDPTGTGTGGPGYEFADELPIEGEYRLGSLAMANAGPDTNGSQFFVISGDKGVALPPLYTHFGLVTVGMDTIDAIAALATGDGPPSETVTINSMTVTES